MGSSKRKHRSKSSSKKKKSEPTKPKKPKSSYLFFCQEYREKVKQELGGDDVKPSRIMQELGNRWRNMSDAQKQPYHIQAQQAKEQYDKDFEEYKKNKSESESESSSSSSSSDEDRKKKKKKKKKKDPNAPKRPLTSYMIYCQDVRPQIREQHPDWSTTQIAKEVGRRWREMSETQKKPYQDRAVQQKADYDQRVKVYKQQKASEESEDGSD